MNFSTKSEADPKMTPLKLHLLSTKHQSIKMKQKRRWLKNKLQKVKINALLSQLSSIVMMILKK